jgi:hypothetical protein
MRLLDHTKTALAVVKPAFMIAPCQVCLPGRFSPFVLILATLLFSLDGPNKGLGANRSQRPYIAFTQLGLGNMVIAIRLRCTCDRYSATWFKSPTTLATQPTPTHCTFRSSRAAARKNQGPGHGISEHVQFQSR